MAGRVIPSLIAKNQKELDERFDRVKRVTNLFQLDVMDGKMVKNRSLMFDFTLPKNKDGKKYTYEAHLMVRNPLNWIKKRIKMLDMVIIHYEAFENEEKLLACLTFIQKHNRKAGIAINPRTKVERIEHLLSKFDMILVMTVNPGNYGAKFLPQQLNKVKKIRKMHTSKKIEVDGGMNKKTLKLANRAGANHFVVGSVLQNSIHTKKTYQELRSSLK